MQRLAIGLILTSVRADVEFPEPSRILMLRGADLILVPTGM